MTAATILADLMRSGIEVRLKDGARLAVPAGSLSPEQRAIVLAHRAELVQFLIDAHNSTNALIAAAMRACDAQGDNDDARRQMARDVEATPPHLRADLMDHFTQTYPKETP